MKQIIEHRLHDGTRLALRSFSRQDVDAVHAYTADPLVCRYVDWGPNSRSDSEAFINEARASAPGAFNLAAALDSDVIGAGAVWTTSEQHACGELGYVLNSRHWGRGYATIVAGMLLGWVSQPWACNALKPPAPLRTQPRAGCLKNRDSATRDCCAATSERLPGAGTRCCTPDSPPTSLGPQPRAARDFDAGGGTPRIHQSVSQNDAEDCIARCLCV